jgi:hypothetical protein
MAIRRYASGGPTFPADLGSYSGLQKAEVYNDLRKDYSDSQLRAAADKQFGKQSDSDWSTLTSYADNLKTLESIYQDIFERPLDPEGRDYWGTRIEGLPKSEIFQLVAGGAQTADQARLDPNEAAIASVKSIFAEQFGRQPTTAELNQYVGFLNDGRSTADISRELDRTLEGYNFDAERIEADYRNQFGRTADQEGFQYWMSVEDASAGKVNQDTITDYIKGGAQEADITALAERPEAGYGVETPLSLSALIADPYGGRYATDLPYLSKTEIDALFPTSKSEGGAYAAAESGIGLPQYYMNIRNWFRDNPNATQAQVQEEAKKWGVSDADIKAAVNPEIGLVSKTLAGDLLKFTTPVTEQPVQSWFDTKGDFTAQAGPNILQREDVDAAINRAMSSGALDQAGANEIRSGLSKATNWSEAYDALNKPKANVVLNELGVQVGEDVDANEALQEANARKELAGAASNLIGGMYPSAVLQGQLAPGMGVEYPFGAEQMQAGYGGTTTKKTLDDIINNLGTDLRLTDQYYQAPASSVPFLRAAYPNVEIQPIGGVQAAGQALLRKSGTYPGLLTDTYRPTLNTEFRTVSGELIKPKQAAGVQELVPLESMTRYGLRPSQEAVAAQAMQPIAPYLNTSAAANINQTGLSPNTPYTIDPTTGKVVFAPTNITTNTTNPAGQNNTTSTINFPTRNIEGDVNGDGIVNINDVRGPDINNNDSGGKAGGFVLYAGGSVMGQPQYFAEGGIALPEYVKKGSAEDKADYYNFLRTRGFTDEQIRRGVEPSVGAQEDSDWEYLTGLAGQRMDQRGPMRSFSPQELGSSFMMPETKGLMAVPRGVVFNPALQRAEMTPQNMAKGGLANAAMKGYAEELRQQGRNGDTILAHINPTEAKMLEAMGGSGTINPRTGLPEYGFSWKKLFKVAGMVLPFLGLPPITTAVASGALAGASTPGKAFDFKKGLMAGLMSYGASSIAQGAGQAANATNQAAAQSAAESAATAGLDPYRLSQEVAFNEALANVPQVSVAPSFVPLDQMPAGSGVTDYLTQAGRNVGAVFEGGQAAATNAPGARAAFAANQATLPFTSTPISPTTAAGTAIMGYGGMEGVEEQRKYEQELALAQEDEEKRRQRYLELFNRTLGNVPTYARNGGLIALAGGGRVDPVAFEGGGMTAPINQPRMLAGGGDGMSDSIPATIDGTQPARLADGEFVIPADVVADIGNGSSSAGAKRLYGMMDRVREARHGTTKQPPEIKMNRLMPA